MKKFWFIREGSYLPSIFYDFVRSFGDEVNELQNFVKIIINAKINRSMRLVRNSVMNENGTVFPLAVSHYFFDKSTADVNTDPGVYRPINVDLIATALETHKSVFFGTVTTTNVIAEEEVISQACYFAHDELGNIINLETQEIISPAPCDGCPQTSITTAVLFTVIKAGELPFYYVLLHPDLLTMNDEAGFDFVDGDNIFHESSNDESSIQSNIFITSVSENVIRVGKESMMVSGDSFTFELINPNMNMFTEVGVDIPVIPFSISTNIPYLISNNSVTFDTSATTIGYFKIEVDAGDYINNFQYYERMKFEFVVHKIS